MAVNTTLLDNTLPQQGRTVPLITKRLTLPATGIANGDNVQVYTVPVGQPVRLIFAVLQVSGTLGASATAQLQVNRAGTRTNLTAATTAGAASKVESGGAVAVPFDLLGGDIIEILIGGAGVSTAAVVSVDLETNR